MSTEKLSIITAFTLAFIGLAGLILVHEGILNIRYRILFYGIGILLIFYHIARKYKSFK